ncbi:hypothetical protein DPMN_132817 [Dreissena polymorpha]|uniref:ShKT domain-containing protein n=1 Tax=Dreissena polymorpha TaxID=45954 RepID=A0A9D4JAE6_DREPO|nr:hypothetical protein DPMN_132817 [Dreissena polymorpha]
MFIYPLYIGYLGNTGGCADQEKHCAAWARHGFCEDNPNTALRICKKSCNACTVETNGRLTAKRLAVASRGFISPD